MIAIRVEFYDKKTSFIVEDFQLDMPKALIFKITETQDVQEIQIYDYDATPEFMDYVLAKHPELADKFEKYDVQFTGAVE